MSDLAYIILTITTNERRTHMMSKWDTIQADVQDQYVHLDEEEEYNKALGDEDEDVFGFSKAISIDHLSDQEIEELSLTLDWKE